MSSHRTALLSPQHSLLCEATSALVLTLRLGANPSHASALASNSSSQPTTQYLTPGSPCPLVSSGLDPIFKSTNPGEEAVYSLHGR